MGDIRTVKVSNFGPFFYKACCSHFLKRVLQKNKWNISCRQTFDLQSRFCTFLAQNSPKEATDLARNGPKFPWGPKLETFTVPKMNRSEFANLIFFLQLSFSLFFCKMRFDDRKPFWRKKKFIWGPKLEALLTVPWRAKSQRPRAFSKRYDRSKRVVVGASLLRQFPNQKRPTVMGSSSGRCISCNWFSLLLLVLLPIITGPLVGWEGSRRTGLQDTHWQDQNKLLMMMGIRSKETEKKKQE
jgi:hypothetical protein